MPGEHGIVEPGTDETYRVGRKWLSALNKPGFLCPEIPLAAGVSQSEIGLIDKITPNGWRLIRADTIGSIVSQILAFREQRMEATSNPYSTTALSTTDSNPAASAFRIISSTAVVIETGWPSIMVSCTGGWAFW